MSDQNFSDEEFAQVLEKWHDEACETRTVQTSTIRGIDSSPLRSCNDSFNRRYARSVPMRRDRPTTGVASRAERTVG